MSDADPFVVYRMADGSEIGGEFTFTTDLEGWFDERDREVRLIKSTYRLVSRELVVLPDPYPIEDDDDDDLHPGQDGSPVQDNAVQDQSPLHER